MFEQFFTLFKKPLNEEFFYDFTRILNIVHVHISKFSSLTVTKVEVKLEKWKFEMPHRLSINLFESMKWIKIGYI